MDKHLVLASYRPRCIQHYNPLALFNEMIPFFKNLGKSKKQKDPYLSIADTLVSSSDPAASTLTIGTSTADPMSAIAAGAAIASLQGIQAPDVTVSFQLSPSRR